MNRKQRRAARVRLGHNTPTNPLTAVQCPDCDADVKVIATAVSSSGRRYHEIEVRHDETCPWYLTLQRDLDP